MRHDFSWKQYLIVWLFDYFVSDVTFCDIIEVRRTDGPRYCCLKRRGHIENCVADNDVVIYTNDEGNGHHGITDAWKRSKQRL